VAGESILVVEDRPLNAKLLRDVLAASGYEVLETGTAEEGLELARSRVPALILMDIQLPGMDGIAALQELRADQGTASIPVIAVTASAMTLERHAIMASGFDGYHSKPISVKALLGEIRRILDARGPV
jgi:CheY-like chemotaxis protein